MLDELRYILSRMWHLALESPETWDMIAKEETDEQLTRRRFMFMPLALCIIIGFSVTWLADDFQHAIAVALRDLIALTTAYFIICQLCRIVINRQFPQRYNLEDSDKVVTYCYVVIIIIQIFVTCIEQSYYLYLLDFFVAYLLWEAARAVFALKEEEQQIFVLYFTAIIIAVPITLIFLLNIIMLRNLF